MLFDEKLVKRRRLHFIGIGGVGMSGIAEILLNLGYRISGSDLRRSAVSDRLAALGAAVREGHAAGNVAGADVVVYSSAIAPSNPEFAAARAAGIPTIMRGELLAELMRLKYGVAVGGSHGKTTTTSMTASVLHAAGLDPTVVVGGRVGAIGSNARLGKGDVLLVEADESDGSFLRLSPIVAVVTNVDREHLDHYGTDAAIDDAFVAFVERTPFYGTAAICADDPGLRRLLPRFGRRVRTYGEAPDADLRVSEVECGHLTGRFSLEYRGRALGRFEVAAVGRHNALNAAAAALVGLELEASPEEIREGLRAYRGVDRRFQLRGERSGVAVIDDYGHHPTEIRATLAAARHCEFGRVHVVFQPHRYSRTALLEAEFARCFGDADTVEIVDIYAAGEEPRPGVNSVRLAEAVRRAGHPAASYAPSIETAVERTVERARPGDAILTLGAGNISAAGETILAALEPAARSAAGRALSQRGM